MPETTFTDPDLTTFLGLDALGLTAVGQHLSSCWSTRVSGRNWGERVSVIGRGGAKGRRRRRVRRSIFPRLW